MNHERRCIHQNCRKATDQCPRSGRLGHRGWPHHGRAIAADGGGASRDGRQTDRRRHEPARKRRRRWGSAKAQYGAICAKIAQKMRQNRRTKAERRAQRELELASKQAALPSQRYGVIVADPEWRFEPYSRETGMDRAADNHYPTSVTDIIAERDVPSIAADDCVLFLWATVPMLEDAMECTESVGLQIQIACRLGQGPHRHRLLVSQPARAFAGRHQGRHSCAGNGRSICVGDDDRAQRAFGKAGTVSRIDRTVFSQSAEDRT